MKSTNFRMSFSSEVRFPLISNFAQKWGGGYPLRGESGCLFVQKWTFQLETKKTFKSEHSTLKNKKVRAFWKSRFFEKTQTFLFLSKSGILRYPVSTWPIQWAVRTTSRVVDLGQWRDLSRGAIKVLINHNILLLESRLARFRNVSQVPNNWSKLFHR